MPIEKTEGIVIKRRDLRETSVIASFYTRDFGKLSGVLKGIRKDPAKFASNAEPFSHNEIIFYPKRNSSIHLISQCDARENFNLLRQDILKIAAASLMMELLDAVMPQEDKNEEIFNLTLQSLKELETNNNPQKIMVIFKIKILSLSGFKPHFDSCVSCGIRINGQAKFSLIRGGLLCPQCWSKDKQARLIFKGTVASILYIERSAFGETLNLGLNPQIKRELDLVLDSFLNFHLEKEFKAQKVLNHLRGGNAIATA